MKEVTMNRHIDVKFFGAFDNCHMGCESCDFITSTHTDYKNGKATGIVLKVECQNAELCQHMIEHIQQGTILKGA